MPKSSIPISRPVRHARDDSFPALTVRPAQEGQQEGRENNQEGLGDGHDDDAKNSIGQERSEAAKVGSESGE